MKSEWRILGVPDLTYLYPCSYTVYRLLDKDGNNTDLNSEVLCDFNADLDTMQRIVYILNQEALDIPEQPIQYVDSKNWFVKYKRKSRESLWLESRIK